MDKMINMKKTMRKKGILMSVFIGMIMGAVFTVIAQLKNQHTIIPMGIVTSIVISAVLSLIIGLIIPMKKVTDAICRKFGITPDKKLPNAIITALVSDIIFTPLNCCVNMWYGMSMGLTDLPDDVTNIFQKMIYCAKLPEFVPALLMSLLTSLIVGFFLCILVLPLINKLTDKICGVPPRPKM